MLHAALTTFLLLQTASGSPNVAPPAASSGAVNPAAPGAPPSQAGEPGSPDAPAPTPGRAATPTPAARRSPTPSAKASGDNLLVVNKTDNTVSILDAATGKLRASVPVEAGPHEVEVLRDGQVAAVSSYGTRAAPGRTVTLIDLSTAKAVSQIDIGEGSRPHGMKALPDGRLLVTAEGKRELVVVDPNAARVTARFPTGHDLSHLVAAAPDGRRAYVTSLSPGSLTVLDLVSGKIVKDIPTGKGAEGLDVTPDGREVWVTNREANTISVIDVKTLAAVFTIQASEFPIRVKITPDGRRAVATFTGTGDVRVYDTATRVEASRIPIGRDAVEGTETRVFQKRFGTSPAPIGLLLAPDGKRAFVSAAHADVVAVIDLEKLRVEDAWTSGREPDGLAASYGPKTPVPTPRPTPAPRPTMRRPG
ncbi:MAG TPA: cytochrome D1 domain-containing protein [Thermoanaerobaculia bacterium]|jgi:YVTN family beta-propeller protein|nr:cytochrome D1 domain-containing protein [Thermoanaerobaculia bacterium]